MSQKSCYYSWLLEFQSFTDVVQAFNWCFPWFPNSFRPCPLPPLPSSVHLFLTFTSLQRARCRHMFMSSPLLFSDLMSLLFMIRSFSERHTSHLSPPGAYFTHCFSISHFTSSIPTPLSFFSQMYVASLVFFRSSLSRSSALCP